MIRGENLVLLGELDMNKEAQGTALREVPLEQIKAQKEAQKQEKVQALPVLLCCKLTFARRSGMNAPSPCVARSAAIHSNVKRACCGYASSRGDYFHDIGCRGMLTVNGRHFHTG